jgi:hypothetical protein
LTPLLFCRVYITGALQAIGNWIWVFFFGWWVALLHALLGCIMFITIIGIPYGKFCFMLVKYWLWPFGRYVIGPVCLFSISTSECVRMGTHLDPQPNNFFPPHFSLRFVVFFFLTRKFEQLFLTLPYFSV